MGVLVTATVIALATGYMGGQWTRKVEKVSVPGPTVTVQKPSKAMQWGVTPGAWCAPLGARGTTPKGYIVRCVQRGPDNLGRWRYRR